MKTSTTVVFCTQYSVKYEDGDREDLSAAECKIAVEYRQKIESGEINEWEIGEE